jgi:hypothetical protein
MYSKIGNIPYIQSLQNLQICSDIVIESFIKFSNNEQSIFFAGFTGYPLFLELHR